MNKYIFKYKAGKAQIITSKEFIAPNQSTAMHMTNAFINTNNHHKKPYERDVGLSLSKGAKDE